MKRISDGERYTISVPVEHSGLGLHCGTMCSARIVPAPPFHGLRVNGTPAVLDAVNGSQYATTLATTTGPVSTVEHLLAALMGRGIDDAEILVEGGEVPILDGSPASWYRDLVPRPHGGTRWVHVVEDPLTIEVGDSRIEVEPAGVLNMTVHIAFPRLAPQTYSAPIIRFGDASSARTFGFLSDVDSLRSRGLIGGASLDTVLVFDGRGVVQNPDGARWPNEPARHKWVDLVGDLALFGGHVRASITATRAGHGLHHALVRALQRCRSS